MLIIPASPGPSVTCTDIPIVDDTIVEKYEAFMVSFEVPSSTNADAGVFNTTRVVIIDNDGKFSTGSLKTYDLRFILQIVCRCKDWF